MSAFLPLPDESADALVWYRQPHPGGWQRWPTFPRLYEAWLILTGRMTLHVAWQRGYDRHIMHESARRANGGS